MLLHLIFQLMLTPYVLFDFSAPQLTGQWQIVNDGVMGGRSQGNLSLQKDGSVIFSGTVSLDNNGGFTSIRSTFEAVNAEKYRSLQLTVKGDQKTYQLRVKDSRSNWYVYRAEFDTSGDWETIDVPFSALVPVFRGRKLDGGPFKGDQIEELGFLIANKRNEAFELQIQKIALVD